MTEVVSGGHRRERLLNQVNQLVCHSDWPHWSRLYDHISLSSYRLKPRLMRCEVSLRVSRLTRRPSKIVATRLSLIGKLALPAWMRRIRKTWDETRSLFQAMSTRIDKIDMEMETLKNAQAHGQRSGSTPMMGAHTPGPPRPERFNMSTPGVQPVPPTPDSWSPLGGPPTGPQASNYWDQPRSNVGTAGAPAPASHSTFGNVGPQSQAPYPGIPSNPPSQPQQTSG